jgi:hypothetical protein
VCTAAEPAPHCVCPYGRWGPAETIAYLLFFFLFDFLTGNIRTDFQSACATATAAVAAFLLLFDSDGGGC